MKKERNKKEERGKMTRKIKRTSNMIGGENGWCIL